MVLASDHITGATGLSPTVTLSKNGGSFASPSGAVTEIANGWYAVAGNASDTNTLGPLILHATAGTADPCDVQHEIVAYDMQDAVRLGLTAIPNAAANANGGLPILSSSGTTLAYTVSTLTTYTGNTPQTGDAYARIGATGSALTSLAPSATALSTAVWTAPPTGFLAATFPATVASPTNITAGTITTVTNLTNAPSAGDFTATMKTSIGTAVAASAVASVTAPVTIGTNNDKTGYAITGTTTTFDALQTALNSAHGAGSWATATSVTVSDKTGFSLATGSIASSTFAAGATIPRVTLADTVTTVTGLTASNLDATISSRASATNLATANTALVKIQAATYDSASLVGSTMTLSDGVTQEVTSTGRVTTP